MDTHLVYKFGGASVHNSAGVRNLVDIVKAMPEEHGLLVVVSAMAKTTNALEELVRLYMHGHETGAKLEEIRAFHWELAGELFRSDHEVFSHLNDLFIEIEWVLEEEVQDPYDFVYDQIVSVGELLSTRIVHAAVVQEFPNAEWLDVRDVIKTDNNYRAARVDWKVTKEGVERLLKDALHQRIFVTQGFIGSTSENFTSTLGREGSDYTAAIFGNILDADRVIFWKDVPGILSGDPQEFDDLELLPRISYREAIEMTYFGAKVIHPRTIKPLQNKQIPLFVKSFAEPAQPGTLVGTLIEPSLPPVIMLEKNQCLVHITTQDYSFVAENHLGVIFSWFAQYNIKVNVMRNSAISFTVCCAHEPDRITQFLGVAGESFNVTVDADLELFTIRHTNEQVENELLLDKTVLLEERISGTVQFVVKKHKVPRLRSVN